MRRASVIASLAAIAAAIVIAAALIMVLEGGDGSVEMASATLTIDAPRDPVAVAAGSRYVWVGSGDAGRIRAYDAASGERTGIGYRAAEPRSIALGPGYLWTLEEGSLLRRSVDGGPSRRSAIELDDAVDVAVGGEDVWVLDRDPVSSRVLRVDAESLEQTGEAFVGAGAQAVAYGANAVWVANTGEGTVSRIDPEEVRATGSPIEVGGRPEDVAAAGAGVWVADTFSGRIVPIDPGSVPPVAGEPVTTLPRPRALAIGFGSVWVASGEAGMVQRFDASGAHDLLAEISVGSDPAAATTGSGRVWTANSESDTLSGIDP